MRNEKINRENGECNGRGFSPVQLFWDVISPCFRFSVPSALIVILLLMSLFPLLSYAFDSGPVPAPERALPAPHSKRADAAGFSDKIIRSIEVRGLSRIKEEELIDLICFSVGDRLNMQDLSKGIRRAFKKGIFLDIQALSEPYKGGIKLTYLAKEMPIVKEIVIEGNEYIHERAIMNNFYFRKGEDFREEFFDTARDALAEFYERRGYPDAKIEIAVEKEDTKAMVSIHINIEEGLPLIINKIEVPVKLRYVIRAEEGDVFDMDKIEEDIERIKKYYMKENHISPSAGPYQFSNGVLSIPVYPGPRLEVIFKNNNAVSKRKLQKELSFIEYAEVTDESIAETSGRIRRLYVSEGYDYARITADVERDEDLIKVTFNIFEGEKVIIKEIRFSGISISPEVVRKIIPLTINRPFNNNLLNESKERLVGFYNSMGYLRADVTEIKKEYRDGGREISLEFVISEGPLTRIKSIEIIGNKRFDTSRIRDVLKLKEELPYNAIDVNDARYSVRSLYRRYGYMDADVKVEINIDKENAFLVFRIREYKPSIVGKIILRGNRKTKARIIKREFSIGAGDYYSHEKITEIKQRLYRLGIFKEISIDAVEPGDERNNELVKDMLVSIKEGNAGSMELSIGYGDYERLRGSFDIRYRNLGGYNRQAGFRTELSAVERKFIFDFREPWFLNEPNVPLKVYLIKEDREAINIETKEVRYRIDKQSIIVGIEKEIVEGLKAGLDYEYSYTDTKDVQDDVILGKEDTGTLGIGSMSPSFYYDLRDNPFNPSSGSLHNIIVKYASKLFLSETEFLKGTFGSSWYFQLMKPVILALSVSGGVAQGFEENKEIPLIERFFLGGRSTVRGYGYDMLGPKGENGNPTGGNVFALTNWELRFSLLKGFGLVTFMDAGNVWETIDAIKDGLKYTVGAGLRYNTPVGPIRADYGYKLDREPGESSGEFHFTFGHAF